MLENLPPIMLRYSRFASKARGQERGFLFISYSPELNSGEYLQCDLKAGVYSGKPTLEQEAVEEENPLAYAHVAKES